MLINNDLSKVFFVIQKSMSQHANHESFISKQINLFIYTYNHLYALCTENTLSKTSFDPKDPHH